MKQNNDFTTENLRTMLDIIKYPVISDKATRLLERNKYTFMVDKRANKFKWMCNACPIGYGI